MTAAPKVWLNLPRRRPDRDVRQDPRVQVAALVDAWERHVGPVVVDADEGDFEEWVESAYRIVAAQAAVPKGDLVVTCGAGFDEPPSPGGPVVELGMRSSRHGETFGMTPGEAVVESYWLTATFRRHAGREHIVCGIDPVSGADVDHLIAHRRAQDPGAAFFLKGSGTKVLAFPIPAGADRLTAAPEWAGWEMVRLDGLPGSLLLQPLVAMTHEYRFFVVGGQVVTGAGCVEEHTPLDNVVERFDARTRVSRSTPRSPVVSDRALVLRCYLPFAQRFVAELAREHPEVDEYVLDVATGPDGPLVVELNNISNAGFYACDPNRLAKARYDLALGRLAGSGDPRRSVPAHRSGDERTAHA